MERGRDSKFSDDRESFCICDSDVVWLLWMDKISEDILIIIADLQILPDVLRVHPSLASEMG